ncbi:MAG: tetratricopeptide repeat protein [Planctomycetes bacterium]|nr:tetratricopeptide repeat protein [Planctomycetota bacterium]
MSEGCWRIELLGAVRVQRDSGEAITRFRTLKTAGVLGYLAYHLGRAHPRETLCEVFWPELAPDAARNNLSRAVSALRRQLEPGAAARGSVLVATRQSLALDPSAVQTDVQLLEEALGAAEGAKDSAGRARAVERALEAYGGPLLEGHFQDWIAPERDRLRAAVLSATLAAAQETLQVEPSRAAEWLRRAVVIDPLCEAAQRELIRLEAAQGETAKAILHADAFVDLLERELGVSPGEETLRVIDEVHARAQVARPRTARAPAGEAEGPREATPEDPGEPPLPLQLEPMFGREAEASALQASLTEAPPRLVTLVGPGGIGKTRLALEVAWSLAEPLVGAVTLVELAEVEAAGLAQAFAQRLGVDPEPVAELPSRLAAALRVRPSLLVLDACEHLLEPLGRLLGELLAGVDSLRCLATSRRSLALPGERVVALGPLPVPHDPAPELDALARTPSVQLFLERARAALPDFRLTQGNAAAVAALVRRLEGIPLALCLAAGWVHVLGPERILARLAESRQLLGRRRGGDPRHETLDLTIAASERLLDPATVDLFRALSVFRGGFTVEAAEALSDDPLTLDRLAELRDVSLLGSAPSAAGDRLVMLELVREYAQGQVAPEAWSALCRRHAQVCAGLAQQARADLVGGAQARALARLGAEEANLRAALGWCASPGGDPQIGLELASALTPAWASSGRYGEGREHLAALLARHPAGDALRAGALTGASALAHSQGDYAAARELQEEAVALYAELGDRRGLLRARSNLGMTTFAQGDLAAARHTFGELVALARELDDRALLAGTLHNLGVILKDQCELAAAGDPLEEAIAVQRALGNQLAEARSLRMLASLRLLTGDADEAERQVRAALELARGLDSHEALARSLLGLGQVELAQGRTELARNHLGEALARCRESGDREGEGYALLALGEAALREGRLEQARRDAEAGAALFRGDDSAAGRAALVLARVALARGDVGAARTHAGACLRADARVRGDLAPAGEVLGEVELAEGELQRAARLLEGARILRARLGTPLGEADEAQLAARRAELQSRLGAAYSEVVERVAGSSLEQLEDFVRRA